MKGIVFFTLLLFLVSIRSVSQTRPESVERKNYGCWASKDNIINMYTDSLNFWSAGKLPSFVYESKLDQRYNSGFGGQCFIEVQFISHRRAILERVVNEEALMAIIKLEDPRLDKLYDPKEMEREKKDHPSIHGSNYPDIPYMKYSTRQLAEQRLKVLRETKDRFKFKKK